MEPEEERAAAELRRLNAESEKLGAEAAKLRLEALKLAADADKAKADIRRSRQSANAEFARLALAVFAAIIAGYKFAESLGWL
ncbi:MAG: hypothetical protein OXH15_10125 [Gammaproteobacteria bacterium]|nr:hypothetical protein [Gammaproteobacteria bacterium]